MSETERKHFATYDEFEAYLYNLGLFRMELNLDRISKVFEELELERPPYAIAHVVGTNGKGSTSSFLTALAQSTGLDVGLYTSPHFVSPRERVRVNGHMLDEDEWCDLANDVMDTPGADNLTYFEFLTVLCVLAFYDYDVDLAVMEAGLGGMYDATTALGTDVTVFVPIAMDHESVLGNTVEEIARDKAGAMRKGTAAITNVQSESVLKTLREAAAEHGVKLTMAEGTVTLPENARYGLAGEHQKENALLALGAFKLLVEKFGWEPPDIMNWDDVKELGMADAWIAGRMQHVPAEGDHPELILDGAHNAHALKALKIALNERRVTPACMVFGCMKDKSLTDIVPLLREMTEGPVFLPPIPDNDRALTPDEIAEALGNKARICTSVEEALSEAAKLAGEQPVLLCGSLYLLAEFFTLRPACLER